MTQSFGMCPNLSRDGFGPAIHDSAIKKILKFRKKYFI